MPDDTDNASFGATHVTTANKEQNSIGLQIQSYCETVQEQPEVDFKSAVNPTLKQSETDINAGLGRAKDHAHYYLRTVQPAIFINIKNISNYYALHQDVASSLPPGATNAEWIATLQALKEQTDDNMSHARDVAKMLGSFHDDLTTDVASFAKAVGILNAAMNGDSGVLANLDRNLADVQGKIDGCIAGIVTSGLAIVGGAFMVAVGAIADFVTAGTTTPLIIAGLAVMAVGVGGEVASALTLAALQKQSADWLTQKSQLKAEVNLVQGMSTGYVSLRDQAKQAVASATAMQNAWQFLSNDLDSLSGDLEKGITNTGVLRKLFLNASGTIVKTVMADTDRIKDQMAGVKMLKPKTEDGKPVNIIEFGPNMLELAA